MNDNPKILLINGPNLNLLGKREPNIYGHQSLADIVMNLQNQAISLGATIEHIQSNAEYELIEAIQHAMGEIDFIIINPAAFTHTSIALRDALLAVNIPFIEIHLSNIYAREPFRQHSYFSDKAVGIISGFGAQSYQLALMAAINHLSSEIN